MFLHPAIGLAKGPENETGEVRDLVVSGPCVEVGMSGESMSHAIHKGC